MSRENINSFDQIPFAINKIFAELESIKEQLAQVGNKTKMPETTSSKKILAVNTICKLPGMKRSTVYNQPHLAKIPHYKANGRVYFDAEEINNWLHAKK